MRVSYRPARCSSDGSHDHLGSLLGDDADALAVLNEITFGDHVHGVVIHVHLSARPQGTGRRPGVTDLDAVVQALEAKKLNAATVDVFETEPLPADSPLWDVERLLVSPHTSGWSPDYADRLFRLLHQNVEALESGQPLHNLVDRTRGY